MRLLYLPCHAVQEYDDISLFRELGINVFSPGAYLDPRNPLESVRPPLADVHYDSDDVELWRRLCDRLQGDGKERLTSEFVARFDAVMVNHIPRWVVNNWEAIKHRHVIWRTIGQSLPSDELTIQDFRRRGLKIVRYSPRERNLQHFAGEDALIRFYKDPDVFCGWTGDRPVGVNVTYGMSRRQNVCNYELFRQVATGDVPVELYGPDNEGAGAINRGPLTFDGFQRLLQKNRAYFYTGTHPASYTMSFIEAWMTGIPIVAIGPYFGNADFHVRPRQPGGSDAGCLYEVSDLIDHGQSGFVSDDPNEIRDILGTLLRDHELARRISIAGRQAAIANFSKDLVAEQWRDYFTTL